MLQLINPLERRWIARRGERRGVSHEASLFFGVQNIAVATAFILWSSRGPYCVAKSADFNKELSNHELLQLTLFVV